MKHWKKIIAYTLAFVLSMSFVSLGISYAGAQDDLNKINKQKQQTKKEINEKKKQSSALSNNIKTLQSQVDAAKNEMSSIQSNINKTVDQIMKAQSDMNALQSKMNIQNTNMNARLRTMYENGNIGMLEILLGSDNISDFLTNVDMAQRIYDSDAELLKQLETQHKQVTAQKQQLEQLKNELKQQQAKEEEKRQALEASQKQLSAQKSSVDADIKEEQENLERMEKEAAALNSQIRAASTNNVTYSGGALAWPVSGGRITSEFGYRTHPISHTKRLHTGMDIGVPTGTPVRAAAAGQVITSKFNSSYGNYVAIDHGILQDGKTHLVTLYAHNSKLAVSVGKNVNRGDVIAYAGSTGDSTGPHCHFEVRVNGVVQNPRNWL